MYKLVNFFKKEILMKLHKSSQIKFTNIFFQVKIIQNSFSI